MKILPIIDPTLDRPREDKWFTEGFLPQVVASLSGIMLFPVDEEQRAKYSEGCRLWFQQRQSDALLQKSKFSLGLFDYSEHHPGPDGIESWYQTIHYHAAYVGQIALIIYQFAKFYPSHEVGLNKAKFIADTIYKDLKNENGYDLSKSKSWVNSAWTDYKSVSHYWALLCLIRTNTEVGFKDPANVGDESLAYWLRVFLTRSELIRSVLNEPASKRRKEPVVKPDDMWTLPDSLPLPRLGVPIGPPSEEALEILKGYKVQI